MTGKKDDKNLQPMAVRELPPRTVIDPLMFEPDAAWRNWREKMQRPESRNVVISINRDPQLSDDQLVKISEAAPAEEFRPLNCTADEFLKMSPQDRGQVLFKAGESNQEWANQVFKALPEIYWFKVVDGQAVGGDTDSLAVPTGQEIVQYVRDIKKIPIVFIRHFRHEEQALRRLRLG